MKRKDENFEILLLFGSREIKGGGEKNRMEFMRDNVDRCIDESVDSLYD